MADPLHNMTPVSGLQGFAGRSPGQRREQASARPQPGSPRAADRVSVESAASVARRLLRERVLARTRLLLELDHDSALPTFAEVFDEESAGAFLGRLLSAQNQLAGRRARTWEGARIRRAVDQALRDGAEETLELLTCDHGDDGAGVAVIAEVMAVYGRRLAALVTELDARDR